MFVVRVVSIESSLPVVVNLGAFVDADDFPDFFLSRSVGGVCSRLLVSFCPPFSNRSRKFVSGK